MRIGYIKDRIGYIPEHDSLLWYFIELFLLSEKHISNQMDKLKFTAQLIAGGPYDGEYADKVVTPLVEDYDKITLMFKDTTKKEEEDEMSFEELDDLVNILT